MPGCGLSPWAESGGIDISDDDTWFITGINDIRGDSNDAQETIIIIADATIVTHKSFGLRVFVPNVIYYDS